MQWKTLKKSNSELAELISGDIRKYMLKSRWYGGKNSKDKSLLADHLLPIDFEGERFYLLIIEVLYREGFVHNYILPIARATPSQVDHQKAVICPIPKSRKHLVDALYLPKFRKALYVLMRDERTLDLGDGYFQFERGNHFRRNKNEGNIESGLLNGEQSNTSIIFDNQFILKIYRRVFRDQNPDIEMIQFLSDRAKFKNVPAFAASITWKRKNLYDVSVGMMQGMVGNQGDAWTWALNKLKPCFKRLSEDRPDLKGIPNVKLFAGRSIASLPSKIRKYLDEDLLDGIRAMAISTAEMHIHLAEESVNRKFTRTSYNSDYAVWLINRINYQFEARYALLDRSIDDLQGLALHYARFFHENKTAIKNKIFGFDSNSLTGQRTRIHGDYHLGQLLVADGEFIILDFEGEPESTIHDRKVKQSPLKDVAGLFRSFHYAIYATIFELGIDDKKHRAELMEIGERLYHWMVSVFMFYYLKLAFSSNLNIGYNPEINYLLKYHLLEKAIYELGYELNARPDWATIPLRGIYTIVNDKNF